MKECKIKVSFHHLKGMIKMIIKLIRNIMSLKIILNHNTKLLVDIDKNKIVMQYLLILIQQ